MLKRFVQICVFIVAANSGLHAQDSIKAPIVDFDYIQQQLQQKSDTVYVINFWATWCPPCVKELPYFEKLQTRYAGKKIKVLLVSLDFKKKYETALLPYIEKNNITTPVVLLYEPDANAWIDKVDKTWSGAIPATLIFNDKKREFYEKEFHADELYSIVDTFFTN